MRCGGGGGGAQLATHTRFSRSPTPGLAKYKLKLINDRTQSLGFNIIPYFSKQITGIAFVNQRIVVPVQATTDCIVGLEKSEEDPKTISGVHADVLGPVELNQ